MAIKENVESTAKLMAEGMTSEGSKINFVDGIYEKTLPEGLTMDLAEKFVEHRSTFVAAGGLAAGRFAFEMMKKDTGLEQVTAELPMAGKDMVEYLIERQTQSQNPQNREEKVTSYGVLTTKVTTAGVSSNSGQLGAVRKELKKVAAEALKQ